MRSSRRRRAARYFVSSLTVSALLFAGLAGATFGATPAKRATPAPAARAVVHRLAAAHSIQVGFETSTRGWYGFGTGTRVTPSSGIARSGVRSLRTRVTRLTSAGGAAYDAGGRGVAVLPSTAYTFVAWVKGRGHLRLTVGFHNAKGSAVRSSATVGSGNSFSPHRTHWHRYAIRFKTPARVSSAVLRVGSVTRQRATFFIDSVSLHPTLATRAPGKQHPNRPSTAAGTTPAPGKPAPGPTTSSTAPGPGATTTTSATTPATTPAPGQASAPSYASAIAYTATRPAFTPLREVDVASQAQLEAAVANIRAGDLVKATTAFSVDGEFQISVNPTGPAVIDLGTGAGAVRFSYSGTSDLPSIWIVNSSNLRIYGGDIHGPPIGQLGGGEVTFYHATNILWWGFHIHDVPGTALNLAPVYGPISGCDLQGEIDHWGENPAGDPHAEKGTGVHAANIADVTGAVYTNSRLALYAHDGPTGAAIQIGNPDSTGQITGDTIILKAVNLTKVATSQVAGNALQEWGGVPMQIDVPYLEATNIAGRAVDANGVYSGVSQSGVRIAYGRATNTNQNPHLSLTESSASAVDPWDPRHGTIFDDVR